MAKDWASLGYGYAWPIAEDNPCTIAEAYVTSDAGRSRYFGPNARCTIRGNGSSAGNLNSDFFTRKGWVSPPFCRSEMRRSRLRTVRVKQRRGKVTRKVVRRR